MTTFILVHPVTRQPFLVCEQFTSMSAAVIFALEHHLRADVEPRCDSDIPRQATALPISAPQVKTD